MPIFDRKLLLQISAIAAILCAVFAVRLIFGGDEDTWLCEGGAWVRHGNPSAPMPEEGCGPEVLSVGDLSSSTIAVPELPPRDIEYCRNRGGKVEYRVRGDKEGYAVCVLFHGRECETNAFVNEECPPDGALITSQKAPAAVYCIVMGGEYIPTRDRNYRTVKETGTCKFLNGRSCKALDFWNGKCLKYPVVTPPTNPQVPATSTVGGEFRSLEFLGEISSEHTLIKTYGATPEEIFKKQPSLLTLVRRFLPGLEASAMKQGFGTVVATLPDKRQFVVFSGCSFDGCVGTVKVGAYDVKKRALYLLVENDSRSEVSLYGTMDAGVKSLLAHVYFSLW